MDRRNKRWPFFTIVSLLILVNSAATRAVGDLHLWYEYQPDIQNRLTSDDLQENTQIPNARNSRSVLGTSRTAIGALISNAVEVPTSSTKYRKLVKRGKLRDAYADFNKLKQTTVFRESYVRQGTIQGFVGDTELRFQIRPRWPSILIYPKDADPIRLVYMDRNELY